MKELEIYGEVEAFLKDEEAYEEDQDGSVESPTSPRATRRPRSSSLFQSFSGFSRRKRANTLNSSRLERTSEDRSDSDDDEQDERAPMTGAPQVGRRQTTAGNAAWEQRHDDEHRQDVRSSKRRESTAGFDDYADMAFSALYESGITLKKRAISLYVNLCELRSFIQLNQTGFRKILKKYDKTLDRSLRGSYMEHHVNASQPFRADSLNRLNQFIDDLEKTYAKFVTYGDTTKAREELRLHLREHVVWERNTVWREMIGIERKAQAANIANRRPLIAETDPRKQGDDLKMEMKELSTPLGKYQLPRWMTSSSFYLILVILAIFFVLLFTPIMDKPEQQNCLALVVFVSLLWATEVFEASPLVLFSQLTRSRQYLSSSLLFLSLSLLWFFASYATMAPINDWNPKLRQIMFSQRCGHPSLCCSLVASLLQPHFPNTTSLRLWPPSSFQKPARGRGLYS